jgi:hypothetical protein
MVLLGQTIVYDPDTGEPRVKYKNLKEGNGDIQRLEGIMIIRFEEGMYFGNVGQLKERLKRVEVHGDLGVHPGEEPRFSFSASEQDQEQTWDDQTVTNVPHITPRLYGVIFDMKAVSDVDPRY